MSEDISVLTCVGRLGADPEEKMVGETRMVVFPLAVQRMKKDETDWFKIITFGSTADFVLKNIQKGQRVVVSGRPRMNRYQGKDGNSRTDFSIGATSVQALWDKSSTPENPQRGPGPIPQASAPAADDDELPF